MEENNNNKTEKQQTVASYVHDDDDDVDDLDLCLGLRHPQHGNNNIKMKRKEVVQNDVVIEGGERRRKVVNWWGNVEMVRVSQGYNRHFTPAAAATAENSRSPVSTGSSYSGVSDSYHSNSYAGGHSSDTSSHSSHSRLHLSSAKQPDSSNEDTYQDSPNHNHNNNRTSNHNQFATNVTSTDTKDKEPSSSGPRSPSPKDTKVVLGKPPKPKRQTSQQSVLLPQMQMPCVSATGNGPNGKTITGFLYKYSKTEVSIVCVCHGTSFSPAGFVEHAGGVDVEHPLRHIRVAPFPLS